MAASTSGALKSFLEAQGLGISVFRDQAPANSILPYVSVDEALAIVPDKLEDGAASTVREHVTVNVWMQWKEGIKGNLTESYALPSAVAKALQGTRLLTSGTGVPPTKVYAVVVQNIGPRLLLQDEFLVKVPIWIEIWRAL